MEKEKLLLVHGGAPTAVMNASVRGVLDAADQAGVRVLGANGGTAGLLKESFIDLSALTPEERDRLLITPGSVIGTSRTPLLPEDYGRMPEICRRHGIRWVLFNGGNGTMDACGHLHDVCGSSGIRVVGIPKTIDNDIAVTDHAPGFGSAARSLAAMVSEVCQDVHALPIHVSVVEAMGRNAGWLAAASSLASEAGYGPDLIYLPERPFDEERFLADVMAVWNRQGCAVVVASEGLCHADGTPIVPPIFQVGRAVYYGDVSAHLASLVIRRLGIKARSEKPGICGRASFAHQSLPDREEAVACGRRAVELALSGRSGVMVTLERGPAESESRLGTAAIHDVMLVERRVPDSWINDAGNGVTEDFRNWCRPLIGGPLPAFLRLKERR